MRLLLEKGADIQARDCINRDPVESLLDKTGDMKITPATQTVKIYLAAGYKLADNARKRGIRIRENFEQARADFDPEYLAQTEASLR